MAPPVWVTTIPYPDSLSLSLSVSCSQTNLHPISPRVFLHRKIRLVTSCHTSRDWHHLRLRCPPLSHPVVSRRDRRLPPTGRPVPRSPSSWQPPAPKVQSDPPCSWPWRNARGRARGTRDEVRGEERWGEISTHYYSVDMNHSAYING